MREKCDNDKYERERELKNALLKKALGYDATETVEEYVSGQEGEIVLSKKKVTKKNVPPDITAIKILIGDVVEISEMTDEQLEEEKQRLLKILNGQKKSKKEKKS